MVNNLVWGRAVITAFSLVRKPVGAGENDVTTMLDGFLDL